MPEKFDDKQLAAGGEMAKRLLTQIASLSGRLLAEGDDITFMVLGAQELEALNDLRRALEIALALLEARQAEK